MSIHCDVYKSKSKEGVYLFVIKEEGLERVPDALLDRFAEPELALSFELTPDRSLAKEDAGVVYANLESQGYHLQLPPLEKC